MTLPDVGDLVFVAALQNGDVDRALRPVYHGPRGCVVDVLSDDELGFEPIVTIRWTERNGRSWLTINALSDVVRAPRRPRLQGGA